MRGNELLNKMDLIDPEYILAADKKSVPKRIRLKKWCAAAACLCLISSLSVPVMAASIPAFYDMLYAVSPAAAQFFKPVQLSCEDNGIRMEVSAAYIHENIAEIYISIQDLEGTKFDETIDLFDSYQINTPFDCSSHCILSGYDPDTHTAEFLVTVEQWDDRDITGDKLTFSLREILSNKKTYEGIIDEVNLSDIRLDNTTQKVDPRGISGSEFVEKYEGSAKQDLPTVLKPSGTICSPVDGVSLTGIGYVDKYLHIQVYYKDILKTDNHGMIALINKETGKTISADGSVTFFDDVGESSYEDYIFTEISAETLDEYDLYGEFITSSGSIEGNWSVTFPLEDTDNMQ